MDKEEFEFNEQDHLNNEGYRKNIKDVFVHYTSNGKIPKGGKLLDLGAITPSILDEAKLLGFETTGWDMFKRKDSGHDFIVGDFETEETLKTFDVIWANHVFEHFHYPLEVLKKCYNLLNDKGKLFVGMPDPFFIAFENVYNWSHWLLRSHHIMWDMDSFCDEAEKVGFKTIMKHRNTEVNPQMDMHLIFEK